MIELLHQYPDEPINHTSEFCDKNGYDMDERRFREVKKILLKDCRVYKRGQAIIVEHNSLVVDREFQFELGTIRCYLKDAVIALSVLSQDEHQEWITLKVLSNLRQAIRENNAQCMGLHDLYKEPFSTYEKYEEFMAIARAYDEDHHGRATF